MITWSIEKLWTTNNDTHTDVVSKIDFRVRWEVDGIWCDTKGFLNVDYSPDNFTDYSSLTENQVVNWVKDTLGTEKVNALEALVENEFDSEVIQKTVYKVDSLTKTPKEKEGLPF